MDRTLLFAVSLALTLSLSACNRTPAGSGTPAAPAATGAPAAPPELIPRDALFGNPERANVQISPDGRYLGWVAAVDGVLNVWVAPADDIGKARAVTADKARGIRQYVWSHRPDTLLYLRDTGGDENFHLFSVDLASGQARDLSDFPATRAEVVGVSHLHPESVLVAMNDRDPKWHDLYRVDLASGQRTLLEKNTRQIAGYIANPDFKVRMASRAREDGGSEVRMRYTVGGYSATDLSGFAPVVDRVQGQQLEGLRALLEAEG